MSNNKFNPHNKINKALLTPLRRLGLPRKRKSSNTILLNSQPTNDVLSVSNGGTSDLTAPCVSSHNDNNKKMKLDETQSCETPFQENKEKTEAITVGKLKRNQKTRNQPSKSTNTRSNNREKNENPIRFEGKNEVLKRESTESKSNSNFSDDSWNLDGKSIIKKENQIKDKNIKNKHVKNVFENVKSSKILKDITTHSVLNSINNIETVNNIKELKKDNQTENVSLESESQSLIIESSQENFKNERVQCRELSMKIIKKETSKPSTSQSTDKTKSLRRSLSMKKSFSPNRQSSATEMSPCLVSLHKLSATELQNAGVSVSVHEDIDELSNSEIVAKMNKLERQVEEKRDLLESLKRANIYKNIHKINDLEELTSWWKRGCIDALHDFLPQLQEYSEMGLAELLNNLRIPPHMIKLSADGNLE